MIGSKIRPLSCSLFCYPRPRITHNSFNLRLHGQPLHPPPWPQWGAGAQHEHTLTRITAHLQSLVDGLAVHGLLVVGGLVEGRGEGAQRHQLLHTDLQSVGGGGGEEGEEQEEEEEEREEGEEGKEEEEEGETLIFQMLCFEKESQDLEFKFNI